MFFDTEGNLICNIEDEETAAKTAREHFSLTDGLKSTRTKLSAVAVNSFLEGRGVLERKERISQATGKTKTFLVVTGDWKKFAFNQHNRIGSEGTTVRYYKDNFMDLMLKLGLVK